MMARRQLLLGMLLTALAALVLLAALYQVPVRHSVDIGGADGGYVRGWHARERADVPAASGRPYLQGAATARWTRASSFLVFPQAGQHAELALRWRAGPSGPVQVRLLLVGGAELGRFAVGPDWSEVQVPIQGGLLKPSDVAIAIESSTLQLDDGREVGVLVDVVTYSVGPVPVTPYPFQLLYGALAGALLYLWLALRDVGPPSRRALALALGLLGLLFVLLFRLQPPLIPYPLRWLLLLIDLLLAALLLVTLAPWIWRRPGLVEPVVAGAGMLAWSAWVWSKSRQHLVLSVPGVERDFSVFAHRSESWRDVLQADGFYNLGYPLLLRLLRPLVYENAFLAGRLIAVGAALLALLATWRLARARWGRAAGLLALLALALSPLFVQYALYLGTDMPFAAATLLALWPLLRHQTPGRRDLLLAGAGAGLAFNMRHPGLLLVLFAGAYLLLLAPGSPAARLAVHWRGLLWLLLGFLLVAGPQLAVNTIETGRPLYNQQAKNIWLAVYGNIDWDNWDEEQNDISLGQLVARDPAAFFSNWWGNLQIFTGTGTTPGGEFERSLQLRMLAWPLNLLAIAGLVGWALRRERAGRALLGWTVLYVLVVALGFMLPRYVLALAPVYALAGAWALLQIASHAAGPLARQRPRAVVGLALLLVLLALSQVRAGAGYVLNAQLQDELALAQAIASLSDQQPILARLEPRTLLAKYSAIAHRTHPWPQAQPADQPPAGGRLVLWEGPLPPDWRATPLASAGALGLYRIDE